MDCRKPRRILNLQQLNLCSRLIRGLFILSLELPNEFSQVITRYHQFHNVGCPFYACRSYVSCISDVGFAIFVVFQKSWVPLFFQAVLLLGAAEWLRTLYFMTLVRLEYGEPWMRMAVILGTVAVFTALSGLMFWNKKLAARYSKK